MNDYAEVPAPEVNREENTLADRARTDDKDFQPDTPSLGVFDELKLAVMGVRLIKNIIQLYEQRNTMNNTTKTMLISGIATVVLKMLGTFHVITVMDDATTTELANTISSVALGIFAIAAALGHHANATAVSKTN